MALDRRARGDGEQHTIIMAMASLDIPDQWRFIMFIAGKILKLNSGFAIATLDYRGVR
jgi:hypothetical protein